MCLNQQGVLMVVMSLGVVALPVIELRNFVLDPPRALLRFVGVLRAGMTKALDNKPVATPADTEAEPREVPPLYHTRSARRAGMYTSRVPGKWLDPIAQPHRTTPSHTQARPIAHAFSPAQFGEWSLCPPVPVHSVRPLLCIQRRIVQTPTHTHGHRPEPSCRCISFSRAAGGS